MNEFGEDQGGESAAAGNTTTRSWRSDPTVVQFGQVARRLPKYGRVALSLARDDDVPRLAKATLVAGGAYLISPIDLIPGVIPVLGQLDDVLVLLLTLRSAMEACQPELVDAHFCRAGLEPGILEKDLADVKAAGGWMAERGVSLSTRFLAQGKQWFQQGMDYLPAEGKQAAIMQWSKKKLDTAIAVKGRMP